MRVSEIRVNQIRVNQGLGVIGKTDPVIYTKQTKMRQVSIAIYSNL